MKLNKVAGATSEIWQVFIQDSSSTTGAGLTGLAFNTASLTAYYHRDTDTTATAITLATMTVGTFTSSGFKEIDATNMPGWYQFCPPNAALASGAKSCGFLLKGAANMAPLPIEVQLVAVNPDSATAFITGVNSLAPPTNWNLTSIDASGRVDLAKIAGTAQTGRDIGASVLLSPGTGTGQLDFTSGVVKANLAQILGTALTETAGLLAGGFKKFFNVATPTGTVNSIPDAVAGASGGLFIAGSNAATTANITGNLTGNVTGSVGSVTGAVGSVIGAVGSVTGNVGGNVVGSIGSLPATESDSLQSGTAQAGAGSTITLASGASATDDLYKGLQVKVYGGTGTGQVRTIIGYVGSTKVATVDRAWATNPDNTSTYSVRTSEAPAVNASLQVVASSLVGHTPQTGDNYARLGAPVGASISADVAAVKGVLPTALVSGRIDASVGAMASGVLTATAIAADAITAAKVADGTIDAATFAAGAINAAAIASDAITAAKIADGAIDAATFAAGAINAAAIAADAIGASELAADAVAEIADAVWDEVQSGHTTSGTFGKYLDAQVSTVGGGSLTEAGIADAVWDEVLSGHLTSGTTGNALNASGSAGDPWSTALPGAYGSGTAGKIIGDNINATISSRATQTSVDTIDDFVDTEVAAIKAKTDNLPSDPADASDIAASFSTVNSTLATIAGYIDTEVAAIKAKTDNLPSDPADASDIAAAFSTVNTKLDAIDDFVDTEVAAILAAVDTEVGAIKAKTDNLPSDPADASDIASSFSTVNATLSTIAGYVDTEIAAIKAKTDQLIFTNAGKVDATTITNSDKTGYRLSATGVDDVLDEVVEGSYTFRQYLRLYASALLSKLSGAATSTVTIRDTADSKDRVVASVDSDGNRTSVTLDGS